MNFSTEQSDLHLLTDKSNIYLIIFVTLLLIVSCIVSLLMVIPITIQYIGSILDFRLRLQYQIEDTEELDYPIEKYEYYLYHYRIMFNLSVFLTIIGSSLPTSIYMTQRNTDEMYTISAYEEFINIWGVCHLMAYLDISGRIFFGLIITVPSLIIFIYVFLNKYETKVIFRIIYISSWVSLVFALISPLMFVTNEYEKFTIENRSLIYCKQGTELTVYNRCRLFDLFCAHLIPLAIQIPCIVMIKKSLMFVNNSLLYEPIIFIVTNIPIAIIDIIEQMDAKRVHSSEFANFYILFLAIYHLGYTCMILVSPIQMVWMNQDKNAPVKQEINDVYKILINRKTIRKTIRRQYTAIKTK